MISISGCDVSVHNSIYSDNARIARSSDSYSAIRSIGNQNGNEYSLSATMTGTCTIWRYDAKDDSEITLSYMLSVTKGGKAKLVFITPDDEVITLVENADNAQNTEMQSQTISLKKGNNRIKIVGYNAPEFELKLNVEAGNLGTR